MVSARATSANTVNNTVSVDVDARAVEGMAGEVVRSGGVDASGTRTGARLGDARDESISVVLLYTSYCEHHRLHIRVLIDRGHATRRARRFRARTSRADVCVGFVSPLSGVFK